MIVAVSCACASSNPEVPAHIQEPDTVREEIEALTLAAEAAYDRERAMANRLSQVEESHTLLQVQVSEHNQKLVVLEARGQTAKTSEVAPVSEKSNEERFDVHVAYKHAYRSYNNRQYDVALAQFVEIVSLSPHSEWSDNAQYWIGECQYGLGKFQQALAEFTKVFSYAETEKADDAQLKVARCYLALGEKNRAVTAFKKLVTEYPGSEYVGAARKEMRYLEGP